MEPRQRTTSRAQQAVDATSSWTMGKIRRRGTSDVEVHAPAQLGLAQLGLAQLEDLVALVRDRQAQLNEDTTALRYLFRLQAGPHDS